MIVFLVIHDSRDYDSSIQIRGCFATSALAEQVVTLDETGVYPATSSRQEQIWRRGHDANCCDVDEIEVATSLPTPFVLNPERPYHSQPFVPQQWVYETIANLRHPAAPTARK